MTIKENTESSKDYFSKKDSLIVKGIAILMLLYHHLYCSTSRFAGYSVNFFPLGQRYAVKLSVLCKVCVALFVFISAYGLTISFYGSTALGNAVQPDWKTILKKIGRRLRKLIIGFDEVFLIGLGVCTIVMPERFAKVYGSGPKMVLYFALDLLGLADLFQTPTYLPTFWYMSTAILIIVLFPLFYFIYKKIGIWSIVLFTAIGCLAKLPYDGITRYLPVIAWGIVFADRNTLGKFRQFVVFDNVVITKIAKAVLEIGMMLAIAYLRVNMKSRQLGFFVDVLLTLLIVMFIYEFIAQIKGLNNVLMFLGVHSMNIFLIHNFIRGWWLTKLVYKQPHFLISLLVLLAMSLAFSVALQGVNRLFAKLIPSPRAHFWGRD